MSAIYKHPLPTVRYIPGRSPRPEEQLAWKQKEDLFLKNKDFSKWQESVSYQYAVHLFNHSYWWEAHEILESFWHQVGRRGRSGRFFQSLIQIAAAFLKREMGFEEVAQKLSKKACSRLRNETDVFLGLNCKNFVSQVESFMKHPEESPPKLLVLF